MKYLLFLVLNLLTICAFAEIDLSQFDLNQEQIKAIRKLEAKNTVSNEVLLKLAHLSHKRNLAKKEFVPEHTVEDLEAVRAWAVGGTFRKFANEVGLEFNFEKYEEEYPVYKNGQPYKAILNFGLTHGVQYYQIDIMSFAINLENELSMQLVHSESEDNFINYLLARAAEYKMSHLIVIK